MPFRPLIAAGILGLLVVARPAVAAAADGIAVQTLAAPSEPSPEATDFRLGGDGRQTRFVMDLSQKVDVAAFTLADPYRVVVDLPQVVFKLPAHAGEQGRGLIKAFRYGLIMQGGSRIVFDTNGPVRVDKAFTLAAVDGQPARLVIDLVKTDRQSFLHDMEVAAVALPHHHSRQNIATQPDGDSRPLVVIDPGHGGIDSGTKGLDGQDEKDIVLAFGLKLRAALEKTGKYRVAMTRSDDTFIPLTERVRIARQLKAALFISVHADSVPRSEGQAEGASVYTLSEHASDAEAARLAETENKSDIIAGVDLTAEPDDVANILIDLAQRETKTFSVQFARTVAGDIKTVAPLHAHPVKSAGFIVLKAPDVPSVLVELGYMSTRRDLKNLTSPDWQERTAKAMAQAVDDFFVRRFVGTASVGAR
ncbi:MAG TPA: N-acetylmuramoyl-L-alanine amidase [Pseudolabrys sp.]|nr:N-acetylmuramoyl-L-alanine amidase [Pseudolabrys sp.]